MGALIGAGLRSLVRDRTALFFSFALPVVFIVLFGLIFGGSGTERTKLLVVGDNALAEAVARVPALEVERRTDREEALDDVRKGDAAALLTVDGDRASLDYAAADQVGSAVARQVVQGVQAELAGRAAGAAPPPEIPARQAEDEGLDYIDFFVPGILAMALAQSAVFGLSSTLVSWRTRGLLRRLRLAPVTLVELIGSRVVVALMLAAVQAVLLLGLGVVLFGVELDGAPWAVIPLALVGTLCFLAIGAVAGALAQTENAAVAIGNVVTLPMVFLSGVFFPAGGPGWLQAVGDVLPLKHLVEALRDVSVRGEGVSAALPEVAVMLGFTVVLGAVALRVFRWDRV